MLLKSILFIITCVFSQSLLAEEKSFLEKIECFDEYGCIEKEILSDTNQKNITELLEIIYNKGFSNEKVRTNMFLFEISKNMNKPLNELNEEYFLGLQLRVLKNLSNCLFVYGNLYQVNINDEKVYSLPNLYTHFYYGSLAEGRTLNSLILKNQNMCVLENLAPIDGSFCEDEATSIQDENIKKELLSWCDQSDEERATDPQEIISRNCKEKSIEDFFTEITEENISGFKKYYLNTKEIDAAYSEFQECRKDKNLKETLYCFLNMNEILNKIKGETFFNNLIDLLKTKDKTLVIDSKYLEVFKVCIEQENTRLEENLYYPTTSIQSYTQCRKTLMKSVLDDQKVKDLKIPNLKEFGEGIINTCQQRRMIDAEKECLYDLNLALNYEGNPKLFKHVHYRRLLDENFNNQKDPISYDDLYNWMSNFHMNLNVYDILNKSSNDHELLKDSEISLLELACLKQYTGSYYGFINGQLWSNFSYIGENRVYTKMIPCATKAIEKLSKKATTENGFYKENVERGMGNAPFTPRFANKGDCIVFTGFTSTSTEKGWNGTHELKIKNCPEGHPDSGAWIDPISSAEGELEVLFKPGTRFRVTNPSDGVSGEVSLECITEEQAEEEELTCY